MTPEVAPKEWTEALLLLTKAIPWAGGLLAVVVVVRYALVPLIRAFRSKGE